MDMKYKYKSKSKLEDIVCFFYIHSLIQPARNV